MILTDDEIHQIRRSIEDQAGLNEELLQRCGDLIHIGNFDEAVRSACVLLEERLRKAAHKENLMGVRLAEYAFNPDTGPLAKHLASQKSERQGLHNLYSGAFRLFRNPTAHGVVGYSGAEAKAIVGFINLLLIFLDRVEELPPPNAFPENVEQGINKVEQTVGPGAASRLRLFLGKCKKIGLEPKTGKIWIPFKQHALIQYSDWPEPKPFLLTVFYVLAEENSQTLWFPVNQYYSNVIGFDTDQLSARLRELGFIPKGTNRDLEINLKENNDQDFFDALFELVQQISRELEGTLLS